MLYTVHNAKSQFPKRSTSLLVKRHIKAVKSKKASLWAWSRKVKLCPMGRFG